MRAGYYLAGRILLILGASVIVAGIIGAYVGPKPLIQFEGSEVVERGEVLGLLTWAQTASGNVTVRIDGAKAIFYARLRGDPLSYLTNATSFGVRVGEVDAHRDVRGGVFLASARLRVDAFTLYFALKRLNSTNSSMLTVSLETGESLVVVVPPARPGEPLTYSIEFHSALSAMAGLPGLVAAGGVIGGLGVALIGAAKVKTHRPAPGLGGGSGARGDIQPRGVRQD
jgi:hypothetical protein